MAAELRHEHRRDELIRRAARSADCRSRSRRSGRRAGRVDEASSTRASSASRFGRPSAAGEALHTFPTIVPRFWIWTPPMARGGGLETVERRRQVVAHEIGPGRERRDAPVVAVERDAAQARQSGDVEDVVVDRASDPCRIDVGAASQHGPGRRTERGKRRHPGWPVAGSCPSTAGQARTSGRTSEASRSRVSWLQSSGLRMTCSTPPRASILPRIRSARASASPSR